MAESPKTRLSIQDLKFITDALAYWMDNTENYDQGIYLLWERMGRLLVRRQNNEREDDLLNVWKQERKRSDGKDLLTQMAIDQNRAERELNALDTETKTMLERRLPGESIPQLVERLRLEEEQSFSTDEPNEDSA